MPQPLTPIPKIPVSDDFLWREWFSAVYRVTTADPDMQSFTPGSFVVETEKYVILSRHLKLTGTHRATLQGTGTLRIT